jgi:hypothetical protein
VLAVQYVNLTLIVIGEGTTYRAVQHILTSISAPLDVALQRTRIQRLQQLEAAQQIAGDRHYRSPVIELTTVLEHD